MILNSFKKFIILVFLLNFYFLKSQNISLSPYGFYGLGEKLQGHASSYALGGIATSYEHPFGAEFNFSNPAANTQINHTIFSLNASSYLGKKSKDSSFKKTFYFSDFSLGFPISKKIIFAASYSPYLGFFNEGNLINSLAAYSKNKIEGKGNVNLLNSFIQYKINDELSLGLMGRYFHGNLKNTTEKSSNSFYSLEESIYSLVLRLGVFYSKIYENKKKWQIGAFYDLGAFTNFKKSLYKNNFSYQENKLILGNKEELSLSNPSFNLPPSASLGISYGKEDKWLLSSQFDWEKTSNFKTIKRADETYKDSYKIALGGHLIPVDLFSSPYFFSKIIYRAGIYYENTALKIRENNIHQYGLNFGLGLPLKKEFINSYIPYLNLSVGINGRGNKKIFRETYANFKMGISFGGKWFGKRIYD